jgi:hypothetical protein
MPHAFSAVARCKLDEVSGGVNDDQERIAYDLQLKLLPGPVTSKK